MSDRDTTGDHHAEGPFDDKPMDVTAYRRFDESAPAGVASEAAIEIRGLAHPCRAATLDAFVDAARSLKQAEQAYLAAQQAYAEAVKRLSEEAVK